MSGRPILDGLRIVDLTSGIAGPYCTKLFVDAGAEVIKVEAPAGDRMRKWSASGATFADGESGPMFAYLNASKSSVMADLTTVEGREFVLELAAKAELVVEDFEPGVIERLGLALSDLHAVNKRVSLISLSHFGRGGPWSNRTANEFTLQAQVGSTDYRGIPGHEPVAAAGRLGEYALASFAAPTALAAVRQARASGVGVHVDLSQHESMMLSFQVFRQVTAVYDPGRWLGRSFEVPSVEPAKDGWVGFCTITAQQFTDFCHLIGAPELAVPELMFAEARMANRERIWAKIREFTQERTVDEVVELASAMRIPVSPIGDGHTVLEMDQFVERGVFVDNPAGFKQPRVPYLLSDVPPVPFGRAPKLGEHSDRVRSRRASFPRARRDKRKLPFEGIKIADFSAFWAGPVAVNILDVLGADVVKIESIQRPDGMRFAGGIKRPDNVWEYSPVTHSVNVGKRAITLDVGSPKGHELACRMVEWADIVVENYAPRVMEHFGLGWDDVQKINPKAIMCRMPAFGLSGPWRERTGFAMTIEQASGLAWTTGHAGGPPMVPRGVCDPVGGMHAAFAMMLALEHRERTGEAQLIEVALIEPALNVAAEQVIEWSANGVLLERHGNRSPYAAPQGVYPALEPDWWVAVSIENDEDWAHLRTALGDPEWAGDSRFANAPGRHAHHVEIDEHLRVWFAERPRDLAAESLIAAKVPAAPLNNAYFVGNTPHHQVRQFHQWMQHAVAGWTPYMSFPFQWNGDFLPFGRPAPMLGEHNYEVLSGILGLSDDEIDALRDDRVIGTRPAWL